MGPRPSFSLLGFTYLPTSISEDSPAPSLRQMSGASTSIPEGPTPTPSKLRSSLTRDCSRFYLAAFGFFILEMVGGVLELGEGITIYEVAEKLYPHLLHRYPVTTTFDTALKWIQASMTEVKWEEAPQAEYLKGPIRTRRVYTEEDVNSLSKAGKTAIRHLQMRLPGIYAPCSAATAASTTESPTPTTERLYVAVAAAVDDTAASRVGWTHRGSPTPVAGERTPAPPVLRVRGGAPTSTMTATLDFVFEDVSDGCNRNVLSRATTDPAMDPLATGTKLGDGTGIIRGRIRGGGGVPGGGGRGKYGPVTGEGGGTGQAARGLGIDLEAVIWATVSAYITTAMDRAADITCAAIEARSDTEETGSGLLEVIKVHIQHICGVATDNEVPSIWAEVAGACTVASMMALTTQFLQTDFSE